MRLELGRGGHDCDVDGVAGLLERSLNCSKLLFSHQRGRIEGLDMSEWWMMLSTERLEGGELGFHIYVCSLEICFQHWIDGLDLMTATNC